MNTKLQPVLDSLKSVSVDEVNFKFEENQIELAITKLEDKSNKWNIVFDGVSAFYYVDSDETYEKVKKIHDFGAIAYNRRGFGEFLTLDPQADVSVPNFAIDVNASSLYIEADGVTINGDFFTGV